jgi:hypothetical protein
VLREDATLDREERVLPASWGKNGQGLRIETAVEASREQADGTG